MKILLVITNYGGGAGIACRRLHQALLAKGFDSNLLVLDKVNSPVEKKVYSIEELISAKKGSFYFSILRFTNRLVNKMPTLFNMKAYINGPFSLFRIDKLAIYKEADIIHLHWVPKIISYKHIFADKQKIFFWTLHDMNPFTGGNHYTTDLDYGPYKKLLQRNIEKKKKYLKGVNLTVISVSAWLGELAKNSEVFKDFTVKVIPNCIDTSTFKPIDKIQARKTLNINFPDKKFILFVADNPNDKRKGMNLLFSALNQVWDKSKICVLIMGKKIENINFDFQVAQLGYKNNDTDIINCYNAADFFVIPSIEDNLPNTVLESLACGTPVIGYNIGGIPDMVIDKKTGLLSDLNDQRAFIQNIESFIEMDDYTGFSINGRAIIEEKFSEQKVLDQLMSLYLNSYKNS
jgi:glycosyltransferase involved in cell wall biosynthesis